MSFASLVFPLASQILSRMDAEKAHRLTIRALDALPASKAPQSDSRLSQQLWGLSFPNPIGLAAGFDKNAEVCDAMLGLGFGFVEAGTLTPRPQTGNPKPRLFRLAEDRAVINRMGFNNEGHGAALRRLAGRKQSGIVGINIGANKDAADRSADYCSGLKAFADVASYVTVNVSSPNTPGLRGLQSRQELSGLLAALNEVRSGLQYKVPLLLKIAPDLEMPELIDIAECCANGAVDGVIVSNTTISRPHLRSLHASQQGGLSGAPLFGLSTRQLARFYLLSEGRIPLVGAGGVSDADTAWMKIEAGASLVQLYSALVYRGPALVTEIISGLNRKLSDNGLSGIGSAVGVKAAEIAHHGLSGR